MELYSSTGNDLARVDVYFRSRKHLITEETPMFKDFSSVLVEVGGALSVYLAMSFFTVVEAFEYIWDLIRANLAARTECLRKRK